MMVQHIFEIVKGKEHDIAYKLATFPIKWMNDDVTRDLNESLGIETEKNLAIYPGQLHLRHVPESMASQFKIKRTRDGYNQAKVNSEINKKFLELVQKHDLQYADPIELTMMFNAYGQIHWTRVIGQTDEPDEARFFVKLRPDVNNKTIEYFNLHESLNRISAKEYYQLLADNERT